MKPRSVGLNCGIRHSQHDSSESQLLIADFLEFRLSESDIYLSKSWLLMSTENDFLSSGSLRGGVRIVIYWIPRSVVGTAIVF